MQSHTTTRAILLAIVAIGIGAVLLVFFKIPPNFGNASAATPSQVSAVTPYDGPPLTSAYENTTLRFSLQKPEDFTAGVLPPDENAATTILLQNKSGDGIQIVVTPYDDVKTLTAADIKAHIPDLRVENPESVAIGSDYQGVAFMSDNAAFGGASREVWFVYKANLYQISTYVRLDGLLKAMFATWNFF